MFKKAGEKMADGKVKIVIEVDGKQVNIASDELDKLGKSGHESGKGISEAEKGMGKAGVSAKQLAVSLGLVKIASAAFNVLKKSLDSAISRFDTLNTFPKIMNSVGVSTQDAESAINKLSNGLEGTTGYLDQVTSNAQRMFFALGDLDKSADLALALQRAFDASGASTDQAKRGTEQYIQALQKGKFDMEEWKTLQETMGVGLNELAKEFGFTGASAQRDLYQALQDGHIPMDQFHDKLIEIGSATGTLGEMAKTNSSTLRNEMEFLANATAKGMANILESVNNLVKEVTGKDIAGHLQSLRFVVDASFNAMGKVIESTAPVIKVFAAGIKDLIPIVDTLTPAILGLMTAYAAYTVITKASAAIQASNAILKVAQASKTGLTLVTKAHTIALAADMKMEQASAAAMIANSGAITLKQVAIGVLTGKITLLTAAQTIAAAASAKFGAVMAALSGPVGWVVAGVGLLTAGTIALVKWFKRTSEEADRLNAETEELGESTNALSDSVESSSKAYEENQTSIKASADANKDLAGRIEELTDKENKSAAEKQLLKDYIEQLNESVEGLNLAYNEEADALSMSSEEMQARIDLMEEQTSYNDALERQVEIEKEMREVEQQLSETNELREEWNQKLEEGSVKSKEHKDVIAELDEQEQILKETTADLAEQQKETEEQITTSIEAITEATQNGVALQTIAFEDLSESQQATVESMKSTWEDYKSSATDMFDTLNDEVEITASEMATNLEENQRIIGEWSENIAILAERGVDEGLLNTLREAGPESAGHVNALVNASDEELAHLSEVFSQGGDVATDALSKSLGIEESGIMEAVGHLVSGTESNLKSEIESADFPGIGNAVPEGLADGIKSGSKNAEQASKGMADDTTDAAKSALGVRSPSTVFRGIGTNITEGLVLGINAGKSKVVQAIQQMFRQVETSSTQSFNNITRSYDNAINQIDKSLSRLPNITQKSMTNMSSTIKAASAAQISALKTLTQNYDREVDNIDKSLNKLPGMAQKSMQNMNSRLKFGSNTNVQVMTKLSRNLISPFNSLNYSFRSIGANAMNGLNAGLNAGRGRVMATARGIANSVAATMRSALRIQSPSRVMKDDVGRWIPEGIAEGIEDRTPVVYDALSKLNTNMIRFSTPEVALGTTGMNANEGIANNYGKLYATLEVDGRQFATATAPYVSNEMELIKKRRG